jgi:hypothetical protein
MLFEQSCRCSVRSEESWGRLLRCALPGQRVPPLAGTQPVQPPSSRFCRGFTPANAPAKSSDRPEALTIVFRAARELYRCCMCVLAAKVDQVSKEEIRIAHIAEGERRQIPPFCRPAGLGSMRLPLRGRRSQRGVFDVVAEKSHPGPPSWHLLVSGCSISNVMITFQLLGGNLANPPSTVLVAAARANPRTWPTPRPLSPGFRGHPTSLRRWRSRRRGL